MEKKHVENVRDAGDAAMTYSMFSITDETLRKEDTHGLALALVA
jgi:hypothetical protein